MLNASRLLLSTTLVLAASFASSQTVFYGGDGNVAGGNGFESGRGGFDGEGSQNVTVYDDFALGATTSIASLFGEFQYTGTITGLHYEIRQGVSAGKAGTLLSSGNLAASVADVGPSLYGEVSRISGAPTSLVLGPGTFFLGLAPILATPPNRVLGVPSATSSLLATTGQNGVGSPLADGNAFINAPDEDLSFVRSTDLDPTLRDFSLGVVAQPTPEPASLAVLGLGVCLLRRRKGSRIAD